MRIHKIIKVFCSAFNNNCLRYFNTRPVIYILEESFHRGFTIIFCFKQFFFFTSNNDNKHLKEHLNTHFIVLLDCWENICWLLWEVDSSIFHFVRYNFISQNLKKKENFPNVIMGISKFVCNYVLGICTYNISIIFPFVLFIANNYTTDYRTTCFDNYGDECMVCC